MRLKVMKTGNVFTLIDIELYETVSTNAVLYGKSYDNVPEADYACYMKEYEHTGNIAKKEAAERVKLENPAYFL